MMAISPPALRFRAGLAGIAIVALAAATACAVRAVAVPALQRRAVNLGAFGVGPPRVPASPFVWCDIDSRNHIRFYSPKIELGQGIHTALAQVFADELGAAWEQLEVLQAGPGRGFPPGLIGAGGSTSVSSLYEPLRVAAAEIREALRAEAVHRFGVTPAEVAIAVGECFVAANPAQRATFGELFAAARRSWSGLRESPNLAASPHPSYVGRSMPRVDLHAKVTGRAAFAPDIRLPGMVYGAVARPPRYGAILRAVGGVTAARAMPGIIAVVQQRGFVGVVAERRRQAAAGLAALDLVWSGGIGISDEDVRRTVTAPIQEGIIRRGGPVASSGQARRILDRAGTATYRAEYRSSMVLPFPLELPAAVADARGAKVVVHTSAQAPLIKALLLAFVLRRFPTAIEVVVPYVGGSFGRKIADSPAIEAARLSHAVGRPVQVAWTMDEELRYSHRRTPTHHLLRAKIGATGRIDAFEHRLAGGGSMRTVPVAGAIVGLTRMDAADIGGAAVPYQAIPNRSAVYHFTPLPRAAPIGGFRSYGLPVNTFAAESFIDELAAAAGADPLDFRLDHLGDDDIGRRLSALLTTAANDAGWPTPRTPGRALGIAAGRPLTLAGAGASGPTLIAVIAEAGFDGGGLTVHRLICAADAGLIVNPDGARAQVEGALLMALSWATREETGFRNGMAVIPDGGYPILRLAETPDIAVRFVERGARAPSGLGEPPTGPVAAAAANAIFALTGRRLRELPLRLDR